MPVSANSAMKAQVRNAALFAEATKLRTFSNMLIGDAPKGTKDIGKLQTDHGAPIVRITDLTKQPGQDVTVDIIHNLRGRPTMGDRKIEGRGDTMKFASDTIAVNQGRHMVDDGGAMFQSTTEHDMSAIAKKLLSGYIKDLDEETTLYHLVGARGSDFNNETSIVPLEDDDEYLEIMVNKPQPPTFSRHFYGGDANSLDTLDSSDLMSIEVIDRLSLILQEQGQPLKHVQLNSDTAMGEEPFYVYFISPRQWFDLQNNASTKDFNALVASAQKRSSGFNHSLFKGDCLMRENILVRKMPRRVRFNTGSVVTVCKNDRAGTLEQRQVSVPVERSILLGAQALGIAYGQTKTAKSFFSIREDEADNGNLKEYTIAWCNGKKALQFKDRDGYKHCHGRMVVDTAVSTN